MGILRGLEVCRPGAVNARDVGSSAPCINIPLAKHSDLQSSFWRPSGTLKSTARTYDLVLQHSEKKILPVCRSFSSFSDGNNSNVNGNFNDNDEEYIKSTVIEAVMARTESDGLMIKMYDGRDIRCMHNNPKKGGRLQHYPPTPAIVLKMEDGSDLLLPLLVGKKSSTSLIAAICNIQLGKPTIYESTKEQIEKMGYAAYLVRVTNLVEGVYLAKLYLKKIEHKQVTITLVLRAPDAINMAVQCKVPIQVSRHLVQRGGMRIVEPTKSAPSDDFKLSELDRSDGKRCLVTEEFGFLRNMLIAVVEERYRDAARWRNKLFLVRAKMKSFDHGARDE
ncbi:bifunctional nuclease 2 [Canna indica]|uniref:Bifunctional nuclease 2 n=1 Tax=Canna indica TaxID=4628 RepID=A0AAQ3L1A3_9LILI|nr:bifunctional nuclease 2 [Canna indica]